MKVQLSINTIIFGLFLILIVVMYFKINVSSANKVRKQEISPRGLTTSNNKIREINIFAKQFNFSPNPIRLNLNQPVRLLISSQDVTHGFSVPELGIDEIINPGKETVFEFTPTKKGTFILLCSIVCGTGHTGMRGKLIVE